MLSVSVVLLAVVAGINIINYVRLIREADMTIDAVNSFITDPANRQYLDSSNSIIVRSVMVGGPDEYGDDVPSPQGDEGAGVFVVRLVDDGPEKHIQNAEYAVFVTDADGNITGTYGNLIFGESAGNELVSRVLDINGTAGSLDEFRFRVTDKGDGGRTIYIVNMGAKLHGFYSFIKISSVVSIVSLIVIAVIMWCVSGKAISPIIESYEKQKRFITDASHEIKTPLAIINADADVLAMTVGEENEWIDDIKAQTSRMNELTNNLILLSKLDEVNKNIASDDIDVKEIVEEQIKSVRAVVEACDIKMTSEISDAHIKGDAKMIGQLISILIDNSVKYCPDRGNIGTSLRTAGKDVIFEITNDTGSDIDEETIRHLFDRFYRADASHNSETGGHGIGLSIAKSITDAHSGKIRAHSDRPGRLTFTVTLPRG